VIDLLRRFLLPFFLFVSLAGCSASHNELLPIPAERKGASRLGAVTFVVRPTASAAAAAYDAEAGAGIDRAAGLAPLVEQELARAFAAAGLVTGRPVDVRVELDEFQVAAPGAALLGRDDRLSALILLSDAGDGTRLGPLRVRVDRANGGLASVAAKAAGGTGEMLVRQMAGEIASALSR
jgi:hypothetical protein